MYYCNNANWSNLEGNAKETQNKLIDTKKLKDLQLKIILHFIDDFRVY